MWHHWHLACGSIWTKRLCVYVEQYGERENHLHSDNNNLDALLVFGTVAKLTILLGNKLLAHTLHGTDHARN